MAGSRYAARFSLLIALFTGFAAGARAGPQKPLVATVNTADGVGLRPGRIFCGRAPYRRRLYLSMDGCDLPIRFRPRSREVQS
jgi:hypothetical protein